MTANCAYHRNPLNIATRLIAVVFMFFCCACSSFAVGSDTLMNEYAIEKLTLEEGFVSSEIYSIIQDRKGFLWFGTAENGVMRYDGRNVTLFEYDRSTASGLSHNDAGNSGTEAPPGITAFKFFQPPLTPPQCLSTNSLATCFFRK